MIDNLYKIIIVDHNEIDESQKFLEKNLVEIIDHHKDTNKNQENIIKKTLSYPLGSCSTLVILENLFLMEKDLSVNLEKSLLRNLFTENLLFFISAILLDTSNFNEEEFNLRWTSLDKLAYEKIKEFNNKFFPKDFSDEISTNYFKALSNSKYDEKANLNLGIPKIFNKDRKEFSYKNHKISWSSLPVILELINENFSENLVENFIQENIEDNFIWVINYQKKENEIRYTNIVIYFNRKNNEDFVENFKNNFQGFLQKEISDLIKSYDIFSQKILIKFDSSITRKKLEPFIKNFLENK